MGQNNTHSLHETTHALLLHLKALLESQHKCTYNPKLGDPISHPGTEPSLFIDTRHTL